MKNTMNMIVKNRLGNFAVSAYDAVTFLGVSFLRYPSARLTKE